MLELEAEPLGKEEPDVIVILTLMLKNAEQNLHLLLTKALSVMTGIKSMA